MGQKVHPHGARVGIIKDWDTRWYADKKDFAAYLFEDYKIREYTKKKLYPAGISRIEIERAANKVIVGIHTGKPGIVIGKAGAGIETLKQEIAKLTKNEVNINIYEVRRPEACAQLVAEGIAQQLERRISFRRAMKQSIGRAMKAGIKGIKTQVSGRLGGADIARSESYNEGSIPLQTLRADIEYGFAEAMTTYGIIGVKVWVYRGEVMGKQLLNDRQERPDTDKKPKAKRRPPRKNTKGQSTQEGGNA
ncbi:MAG: 30S ribosomal protein S3 [Clostridia bacterium]|nr:30S ribosomal protein S3 [Clostridia bacterium]